MHCVWNHDDGNHETELRALVDASTALDVICPYIHFASVEAIIEEKVPEPLRVMTLWDARAFILGGSELEALKLILREGGQVRTLRSGLHAKVYIGDGTAAIVTSANLANSGLRANLECGIAVDGDVARDLQIQFDSDWRRAGTLDEEAINQAIDFLSSMKDDRDDLSGRLRELEEAVRRAMPGPPTMWSARRHEILVELTDGQIAYITRPLRGQGGYQSLLARLQDNLHGRTLRLSRQDCERIVRYSTQYGEGGFQGRLRTIVEVAAEFIR
jgi:hypothetical protein